MDERLQASKKAMDAEFLGRLLDEHAAALELFARQWCDSPEDVVQEAFMNLATRKAPENVVPWLYRAVRNGAISAARSGERRRRHEAASAAVNHTWLVPAQEDGLDAEAAVAALRALPVELRETIVARLWGGLTFEEIGEVTECSSSTAHRRYVEGLGALRERLKLK